MTSAPMQSREALTAMLELVRTILLCLCFPSSELFNRHFVELLGWAIGWSQGFCLHRTTQTGRKRRVVFMLRVGTQIHVSERRKIVCVSQTARNCVYCLSRIRFCRSSTCRVLLKKWRVTELVNKLPAFYGTGRFIVMCTSSYCWTPL